MRTVTVFASLLVSGIFCSIATSSGSVYVKEFGATEGQSLNTGAVIMDGQCLDPPYVVSRRGLALFVNGREIQRPRRHIETPILTGEMELTALTFEQRQKLCRKLEGTRSIYERHLSGGGGYVFSSKGGHIKMSSYTVAYDLPEMIAVLSSGASEDEKTQILQDRNWHLLIDIGPLLNGFVPSAGVDSAIARQAEALLRVDEFGMGEPVTVSEGFFFLNGHYIDQPYVFQRKGLGLFLNGDLLAPPSEPAFQTPTGDADVSLPAEIDAECSWFDEAVQQYLGQKKAFLCKQYTPEQAQDMMVPVIEALPLVTATRRDESRPEVLQVTTTEGLTINRWIGPPLTMRTSGAGREDDARARVDEKVSRFQKTLGRGSCYIMSRGSGWTRLPARALDRVLPPLVETLHSNGAEGDKRATVRQLCPGMPDKAIDELLSNFSRSSQLESRMTSLCTGHRLQDQ